jgi:hypothetical protein
MCRKKEPRPNAVWPGKEDCPMTSSIDEWEIPQIRLFYSPEPRIRLPFSPARPSRCMHSAFTFS